jgi:hypothetical protein
METFLFAFGVAIVVLRVIHGEVAAAAGVTTVRSE